MLRRMKKSRRSPKKLELDNAKLQPLTLSDDKLAEGVGGGTTVPPTTRKRFEY